MTQLFTTQLQTRNSRSGSMPLITYYDEANGERTELSGISFANWVDKTAGLLVDELMIDPGSPVLLTLARTHPAHWMSLVWVAASWRAGCPVMINNSPSEDRPEVEVVGPDEAVDDDHGDAVPRIACSLHPFGLGFTDPLPEGVIDYGVEVRAQPDIFSGPPPALSDLAWIDDDRRRTHAEITDAATSATPDRVMITTGPQADPWAVVVSALIKPVFGGGSAVIVRGADAERSQAIADAEQVDARIEV